MAVTVLPGISSAVQKNFQIQARQQGHIGIADASLRLRSDIATFLDVPPESASTARAMFEALSKRFPELQERKVV